MNKELEQNLTQFVSKALDVANKGIDATSEQIPLVLQEIIQGQLWSSIGFIALFTTISILCFSLSYYLYRNFKQTDDFDNLFVSIVTALVALFLFVMSLICNVPTIIKVLTAPRLVILDYLKGLL